MKQDEEDPGQKTPVFSLSLPEYVILPEDLKEDRGYEAVLTTGSKASWNFSVVGFRRRGRAVFLQLFEGSDSYRKLGKGRKFGLTLLPFSAVTGFFKPSLLGWGQEDVQECESSELEFFHHIPFLKDGVLFLHCQVVESRQETLHDGLGEARVLGIRAEVSHILVKPEGKGAQFFSRAPGLLVEAMVHFTKLQAVLGEHGAGREQSANVGEGVGAQGPSERLSEDAFFHLRALRYHLKVLEKLGWARDYGACCTTMWKMVTACEDKTSGNDP